VSKGVHLKSKKGDKVKEPKNAEVAKLKKRIRLLEKQKKDLVSQLKSAEKALERNMKFLKGSVEDISVEELIEAAKEDKTLKEVKVEKECPNCGSKNLKVMNILGGKIEICPDCSHRGKL